jgi:hypothetical protein
MDNISRYFLDTLKQKYYDKFDNKKENFDCIDRIYLEKNAINGVKKSEERINQIKKRLIKDNINKKKYYQIRGFYEYKILKKYIKEEEQFKNYELLWCNTINGENIMTNKLIKIIEGTNECCRECSKPPTMINKKVSVMYVYLSLKSVSYKQ